MCACGLVHSIFVTTPFNSMLLLTSNSAAAEWCANTGNPEANNIVPAIAAPRLVLIPVPPFWPDIYHQPWRHPHRAVSKVDPLSQCSTDKPGALLVVRKNSIDFEPFDGWSVG